MTRRECRDRLEHYLYRATRETAEAYTAYLTALQRVEVARVIGPRLRAAYAALELAECYRRLAALEVAPDDAGILRALEKHGEQP